jgi:hypothetical protein
MKQPAGALLTLFSFYDVSTILALRLAIQSKMKNKKAAYKKRLFLIWLREQDLNLRPSGYEPDELPSCSIPRQWGGY